MHQFQQRKLVVDANTRCSNCLTASTRSVEIKFTIFITIISITTITASTRSVEINAIIVVIFKIINMAVAMLITTITFSMICCSHQVS